MSDLERWLAALGLERYAPAFAAAEVDLDTLRYLTDADLQHIGLPLGPRRRLLAARETIDGQAASTPPASLPERRQITVMFVDLVGSTRLSSELDPEILADLMKAYKDLVAREIVAAGGFVAKYLGDGVLAYFGWPQAREDAAEASIRCALQVVEQLGGLRGPGDRALQCRIGIATGLVVVGGELGEGRAREDAIAGEAPNLAARLQALAAPDGIVISEATRRQIGELFECEPLGEQIVSGFSAPVKAWRAIRVSPHGSRFKAARAMRTSFIGRRGELSLLADRWRTACEGAGRAVLVLGEAGMGKSRLAAALQQQIAARPHRLLTWQCSPYHQAKPLYPVVEHIVQAAGLTDAMPPPERLRRLADLLAEVGMLETALPLFAQLLAIPAEAGYAPPTLGPAQLRAATIVALRDWVRRIAGGDPVLLLIEDAHWIDATTLELAVLLVGSTADAPLLTIVTARPEFASPWRGKAEVGIVSLDKLNNQDCESLVRELATEGGLQDAVVSEIISRSDGNPLFVEELSAAVFHARPGQASVVPDSLQSSLMARLDRLGDAKHTAQVCSVLGRRFARPLLALVAGLGAETLDEILSLLVAHDLVRPLSDAGEDRYEFKHALLRDAAYESLLLSERRRLHEACALRLEENFAEVVRTEPELLAQHFSLAGLPHQASRYSEQAGDRAAAVGSLVEVVANYQEAARQNELLPESLERDRRTLELLLKLGPAVSIIDGAQAPRLRDLYQRAERLSRTVDDQDALFKSVWGLWYNANIARDLDDAAGFAQKLVQISVDSGQEDHRLEALHCRWSSALFRGEYATCGADAERGMGLYDQHRHRHLGLTFGGHDPGVCALGCLAQTLSFAGEIEAGRRSISTALDLAAALDHGPSVAHGLLTGLIATTVVPDIDLVQTYAERILDMGRRFNVPPQQAIGSYHLAWVETAAGDRSKGLEQMAALFDRVTAMGPITMLYRVMYVDQLLRAGRAEQALSVADQAVAALRFPETGLLLCELYRLRGECLGALGRKGEAIAQLLQAQAMAARGGAPLLGLRAALGLHRVEGARRSDERLRSALDRVPETALAVDVAQARVVLGLEANGGPA